MTKQFAVVGNPIEHSRSPELHHAFAAKIGIDLHYQKILSPLDGFEQTVKQFFEQGGSGLNITVPFKEQAFALCDVQTERAKIARAVNTLWMQNGKLHGDNTDGQGLVVALQAQGWNLQDARILILGAGGATRGVIYPLAQAGVKQIIIANRTLARAEQLIADVQPFVADVQLKVLDLNQLNGKFDIIINATSASLSGDHLQLPQSLTFDAAYEMAYGKDSSFIAEAKARQIPYAEGFSMLVGQAIEAFAIWNGERPNLEDFI